MAAANSTRASGIQIQHHFWGLSVKGTREQLVEHGYAQDGHFPGDPGQRKTSTRSTDAQGREIEIRRASKHLFTVCRNWNEDEAVAVRAAAARRAEVERATELVNAWPTSGAAFRASAEKQVEMIRHMLEITLLDGERGGYRLDDSAALRLELLGDQLLELVRSGGIVKDLALREKHTPACIAKSVKALDAAKTDKTFRRFMDGIAG